MSKKATATKSLTGQAEVSAPHSSIAQATRKVNSVTGSRPSGRNVRLSPSPIGSRVPRRHTSVNSTDASSRPSVTSPIRAA